MQEAPALVGQEAVDEEVVFFEAERFVLSFEVAGVVVDDAMPEDEVLGPCRRSNRVGLDEAEALDRVSQRRRREERVSDSETPKLLDRELGADG
jgi:hypothetical protein